MTILLSTHFNRATGHTLWVKSLYSLNRGPVQTWYTNHNHGVFNIYTYIYVCV